MLLTVWFILLLVSDSSKAGGLAVQRTKNYDESMEMSANVEVKCDIFRSFDIMRVICRLMRAN